MKTFLKKFGIGIAEGISRVSAVSLFIAAGIIVTILLLVSPAIFTLIPHEFLILNKIDLDILALQKAQKLVTSTDVPLSVTLIGASSLQEALLDEKEIESQLKIKLKREVDVTKIGVRGMKLFDMVRFIDYIPGGYNGVVLFCISMENAPFIKSKMHDRLPLPSPTFNHLIVQNGLPPRTETGIYLFDNIRFFSIRTNALMKSILFGPIDPITHFKDGVKLSQVSEADQLTFEGTVKYLATNYPKKSATNFAILSILFEKLQSMGVHGIFLHPPRNIDFIQPIYASINKEEYLKQKDSDYKDFAEHHKITYWNFNDQCNLTLNDFRDYNHISNDVARTCYTNLLIDNLATIIDERSRMQL